MQTGAAESPLVAGKPRWIGCDVGAAVATHGDGHMTAPLQLVFLGSDPIALPLLDWLAGEGSAWAKVVAVWLAPLIVTLALVGLNV